MFGWWLGLPAWLRMLLGLVVLLLGGGIVLAGMTGHIIEGQRVFHRPAHRDLDWLEPKQ